MGAVQPRNTVLKKMRVLILLSVLSLLLGVSFGSDEPNEAARRQSDASRRQSFNQRPPPFLVIGLLEGNPMPQEDNSIIHRRLLLVLGLEGNPMPLEDNSITHHRLLLVLGLEGNPMPLEDNSIIHHRLLLVLGEQSPDVPDSELLHTPCN